MEDNNLTSFLENTPFLYSINNDNAFLPINNTVELSTFVDHVETEKLNGKLEGKENLVEGIQIINNNDEIQANNVSYFKGPNSVYYFKVFSSIMTPDFFDKLMAENDAFQVLYTNAKTFNSEFLINVGDSLSDHKTNLNEVSGELNIHYGQMRKHNNAELAAIKDDNTTLLRQASINNDMYLRRQFLNKRLNSTFYFICLLILVGFLKSINYNSLYIFMTTIVLLILYIINIALSYKHQNNMHKLNFNQLQHPGFPIRDEKIQQKYFGDCSSSSNSNSTLQGKCNF